MTNAIIKRLVQKGWLTVRKVNNRNLRYAVSASGIEQITRRSYRYFKRTIKNIVDYREAIERFVHEVQVSGCRGIILHGSSDLDFIVEHACAKYGIEYVLDENKGDTVSRGGEVFFLLYSESYIPDNGEKRVGLSIAFLQEVVNLQWRGAATLPGMNSG